MGYYVTLPLWHEYAQFLQVVWPYLWALGRPPTSVVLKIMLIKNKISSTFALEPSLLGQMQALSSDVPTCVRCRYYISEGLVRKLWRYSENRFIYERTLKFSMYSKFGRLNTASRLWKPTELFSIRPLRIRSQRSELKCCFLGNIICTIKRLLTSFLATLVMVIEYHDTFAFKFRFFPWLGVVRVIQ